MKNKSLKQLFEVCDKQNLLERYLVVEVLNHVFLKKESITNFFCKYREDLYLFRSNHIAYSIRVSKTIIKNLQFIDDRISNCVKKMPSEEILNILRLSVQEIYFEKIPEYASVNSAVNLAKIKLRKEKTVGFVNAILRSVLRNKTKNKFSNVYHRNIKFPTDLAKYCIDIYGSKEQRKIWESFNQDQKTDITIKNKNQITKWEKMLDGNRIANSNSIRLKNKSKISDLPGYEEGEWWVQNYAATLPVLLLGNIDNADIIDCCAAPGGKTMQLSSAGACTTSIDISSLRMKVLNQNLARTKLNSKVIISDIFDFKPKKLMDAVIMDAPCSATGTLRKNPDIEYLDPISRINFFSELQNRMLNLVKDWIKPGGRLVFSTCSIVPEEGENIIFSFLKENKDYLADQIKIDHLGLSQSQIDHLGGLKISPNHFSEIGGVDGFYIAVLKKYQ